MLRGRRRRRIAGRIVALVLGAAAAAAWMLTGGVPRDQERFGAVPPSGTLRVALPHEKVSLGLRGGASPRDVRITVREAGGRRRPVQVDDLASIARRDLTGSGITPLAHVDIPRAGRYEVTVRPASAQARVVLGRAPWTPAGSVPLGALLAFVVIAGLLLVVTLVSLLEWLIPFFPWGTGNYDRRRAKAAPAGWVAAEALVEDVQAKQTSIRVGTDGENRGGEYVYDTTTTYAYFEPGGALRRVTHEARLRDADSPRLGRQLTIAFDPAKPENLAVLEDEAARLRRRKEEIGAIVRSGSESPAVVATVRPTGLVSSPRKLTHQGGGVKAAPWAKNAAADAEAEAVRASLDSAQVDVTLNVTPTEGAPFAAKVRCWDRDMDIAPGTPCVYFHRPGEPDGGHAVFAEGAHRASNGNGLAAARDELLGSIA